MGDFDQMDFEAVDFHDGEDDFYPYSGAPVGKGPSLVRVSYLTKYETTRPIIRRLEQEFGMRLALDRDIELQFNNRFDVIAKYPFLFSKTFDVMSLREFNKSATIKSQFIDLRILKFIGEIEKLNLMDRMSNQHN